MSGKENLDGRRNGSAPGELVLELELLFSSHREVDQGFFEASGARLSVMRSDLERRS
jgi:hypothetical protein